MSEKKYVPMEEMDVFRGYVEVADRIWQLVAEWKPLATDTVGKQLVRAADSVGANLVEGDGRYSDADALHFFIIARASARETRYWIQRAITRGLISQSEAENLINALTSATRQLNTLIHYRRGTKNQNMVREASETYLGANDDPFVICLTPNA